MKVEIRPEPYHPWQEIAAYQKNAKNLKPGSYGACVTFVGTMRDFNAGDEVRAMLLEHYPGMTEQQLQDLAKQAIAQHALLDVLLLHRVGAITPNEPIVLVATWAVHRAAAFVACREIMVQLKSKAAFWKKEQLADGARWVEKNTPDCQ